MQGIKVYKSSLQLIVVLAIFFTGISLISFVIVTSIIEVRTFSLYSLVFLTIWMFIGLFLTVKMATRKLILAADTITEKRKFQTITYAYTDIKSVRMEYVRHKSKQQGNYTLPIFVLIHKNGSEISNFYPAFFGNVNDQIDFLNTLKSRNNALFWGVGIAEMLQNPERHVQMEVEHDSKKLVELIVFLIFSCLLVGGFFYISLSI